MGRRSRPVQLAWALLFVCPVLAAALEPSRALTQYRLDRWTPRTGLPTTSVLCLLQDRAGYLWAGTQEGLARFDGIAFRTFKVEDTPALASNYVSALFEDRRGRIWAGTDAGDLSYFDGERLAPVADRDGRPIDRLGALVRGADGAIWGGGQGRLFRFSRGAGPASSCRRPPAGW